MVAAPEILVVAATPAELAPTLACATLVCGVGPVDAAVRVASVLADHRPRAILHVGIAGARRASGLGPATLVIGTAARYSDLRVPMKFAPSEALPDARLLDCVTRALPDALRLPIATVGRVGASVGCDVEGMEGFAVLRAAELAGVPAIEVRAISNEIEESDRSRWHFDHAFSAITAITPRLVEAIAACKL